jgi:hypothetical protein
MSQQKQDQKEDYQCLGFGIDLLITRCTIWTLSCVIINLKRIFNLTTSIVK